MLQVVEYTFAKCPFFQHYFYEWLFLFNELELDFSDKFHNSRGNLKRENLRSCKRSSNKLTGVSEERREAVKYLCKNRSRRGLLLKFVTSNKVLDKKRKKMDSSQCKKSTKKSNHTSVSPPVAAGSSQWIFFGSLAFWQCNWVLLVKSLQHLSFC